MKFVALVSGGKDSFYSIMECIRNGHELLACAHLSPRCQEQNNNTEDDAEQEEEESYMYQTAASEAIPTLVEECLGVPLVIRQCVGRSQNTSLVYDHDGAGGKCTTVSTDDVDHANVCDDIQDEVEDLYELLLEVKRRFPSVQAISSGAILSTYQRTRIESVCSRINLTPLGYLWRSGTQRNLLECMLKDGIEAVLVKVASPPGLLPQKHLNKTLGQLFYGGIFDRLKEKFDFHICGEGGEYETLVLDCPLFAKRKLCLDEVEIVETDDGVGILRVLKCSAVDKDSVTEWAVDGDLLRERLCMCGEEAEEDDFVQANESMDVCEQESKSMTTTTNPTLRFYPFPHVKVLSGGLAHVSEIMSRTVPSICDLKDTANLENEDIIDVEGELAVLEAKCVFNTLKMTLSNISWTSRIYDGIEGVDAATPKDVVFVHLYLSSISHFAKINKYYQDFFGIVLPPSRSCVAVGENVLRDGRRVMMDCMIQRGSGTYMRIQPETDMHKIENSLPKNNALFIKQQKMNPHHDLRSTLHVQTISHWAPVCVGPYSQANTLRSGLTFMAGQIGLVPNIMELVKGGWKKELVQCWKNAACVLDALNGSLDDILGCVVYINSVDVECDSVKVWEDVEKICKSQIRTNGGVVAGKVDGRIINNDEYGGYEDYETWKEMESKNILSNPKENEIENGGIRHILAIALPQMPKGALSEVELVCATKKATSCLDMNSSSSWTVEENGGLPHSHHQINSRINWDINNDNECAGTLKTKTSPFRVESVISSLGTGCAAIVNTVVLFPEKCDRSLASVQPVTLIQEMVFSAVELMKKTSGLDLSQTMHVRLFHTKLSRQSGIDDHNLRLALHSILAAECAASRLNGNHTKVDLKCTPASSLIPVDAIYMFPFPQDTEIMTPALGMQIIAADLVHLETEMWIHHNRSYNS